MPGKDFAIPAAGAAGFVCVAAGHAAAAHVRLGMDDEELNSLTKRFLEASKELRDLEAEIEGIKKILREEIGAGGLRSTAAGSVKIGTPLFTFSISELGKIPEEYLRKTLDTPKIKAFWDENSDVPAGVKAKMSKLRVIVWPQ